jgi:prepilin-type N-terminal cleavage/methylation domain-containing protein/prepilin-type processing-associated H-X9-DG protein
MNTAPLQLPPGRRGRHAFTLVELLVVIAIIGVLMGMMFPAVKSLREVARRTTCTNHLTQLGLALQNYESAHGVLPPGTIDKQGPIHSVAQGYQMSWLVQILPYLDEASTQKHVDFRVGVYDKKNAAVRAVSIALFLCPSSGTVATFEGGDASVRVAVTNYAGCHHDVESPIDTTNHGVLFLNSRISQRDVTDGSANTIYVGEKHVDNADLGWMSGTRATLRNAGEKLKTAVQVSPPTETDAPRANDLRVGGFGSRHAGVCNFLFGDGAVHTMSADTDIEVLQQLANRSDGKLLNKGPTRAPW